MFFCHQGYVQQINKLHPIYNIPVDNITNLMTILIKYLI